MKSHTVIFDWNGTLFDDFEAIFACNNTVLERFGRPHVTADVYREHYEVPFAALLRNQGFNAQEVAEMDHLSKEIFHDHYEPQALRKGLRTGGDDILNHIKESGIRSIILSNHLVSSIRAQLQRLEIEHLFSEVLAYADRATQFRHMTKGDKLRDYMQHEKIDSGKAIIVGDSIEEVEIARDQGLISVAITGGCVSEKRLKQAGPHYLIHSLQELKPILEERGFLS